MLPVESPYLPDTRLTSRTSFVKTRTVSRHTQLAILVGALSICIRFIAIDRPFDDRWSWRQSDVAAIARNYSKSGFRFAYPQIDWAGDQPGYVGTEFPILPFIAALLYKLTGIHESVGRLLSVMFFAVSLPFFFILVREIFDPVAAIWSLVFYSVAPVMLMASRCFMPDVPSLSLGIIALYYFKKWTDAGSRRGFWISALTMSAAMLIKLPTAVLAAPFALMVFRRRGWSALRELNLYLWAAIALLPSTAWYVYAHRIAESYYPFHFFGGGGVRFMPVGWYGRIAWHVATASLTPALTIVALFGTWIARRNRGAQLFYVWLGAMCAFVAVVGWGNRHEWYQLPFVPIAAAFGGMACSHFMRRLSTNRSRVIFSAALLLVTGSLSIAYTRRLYEPSGALLRDLGLELQRSTAPRALIVAADDGDPTVFYYAERKGWHFPEEDGMYNGNPANDEQLIEDLDELQSRGATHIVFYAGTAWWLDYYRGFADYLGRNSTLMRATEDYRIYELNRTR